MITTHEIQQLVGQRARCGRRTGPIHGDGWSSRGAHARRDKIVREL